MAEVSNVAVSSHPKPSLPRQGKTADMKLMKRKVESRKTAGYAAIRVTRVLRETPYVLFSHITIRSRAAADTALQMLFNMQIPTEVGRS